MKKFRELFEAKTIKKGDKFWDGIDQYRIDSVNTSKKTAMITFIPNGEGSEEIDFKWIKNTYTTKTYRSDRSTNKKVGELFESKVISNVDLDLFEVYFKTNVDKYGLSSQSSNRYLQSVSLHHKDNEFTISIVGSKNSRETAKKLKNKFNFNNWEIEDETDDDFEMTYTGRIEFIQKQMKKAFAITFAQADIDKLRKLQN